MAVIYLRFNLRENGTVDLCNLAQQIKRCNKKQVHHLADILDLEHLLVGEKEDGGNKITKTKQK